jgi:hypothetical protein
MGYRKRTPAATTLLVFLVRGSVRSGAKSGMSKSEREQREREERKAFGYYEDLRRKVMAALEGEA